MTECFTRAHDSDARSRATDVVTRICLMEKCALEFLSSQVQHQVPSYSADNLGYRTVDYRRRINALQVNSSCKNNSELADNMEFPHHIPKVKAALSG